METALRVGAIVGGGETFCPCLGHLLNAKTQEQKNRSTDEQMNSRTEEPKNQEPKKIQRVNIQRKNTKF